MIRLRQSHLINVILIGFFSALVGTNTFAQHKTEIFTTIDGKKFTRHQRDSIERLGNFIGVKEKKEIRDTLFYAIFYYDKSYLLTPLQRRFLDKPFPALDLSSLEGEKVSTENLKGKVSLIMTWDTSLGEEVMIQLNDLYERYKDSVNFVAISPLTEEEVRSAFKIFRFSFMMIPNANTLIDEWKMDKCSFYFLNKEAITKRVDTGIPVRHRKRDYTATLNSEGMTFIVYEYFSEILDGLLTTPKIK